MNPKSQLMKELKAHGVFTKPAVEQAFQAIDRANFVPDSIKRVAYMDEALPIGFNQTISQPYTVAFMLQLLNPEEGQHIMDVGFGSGWQTALLAHIVGVKGHVYAIELIPALYEVAKQNLEKYPALKKRTTLYCQNASLGLPDEAKEIHGFDKIISAASVIEVPTGWRQQLKNRGVMVYPKAGSIFKEEKINEQDFLIEEYPGFVFVPFIAEQVAQK